MIMNVCGDVSRTGGRGGDTPLLLDLDGVSVVRVERLAGGLGADAAQRDELRGGVCDERPDLSVRVPDLLVEVLAASCEPP